MIEMGILDPTKVARVALQNAASIAGLMVTTEVMVAETSGRQTGDAHGRWWNGRYGWNGWNGRHDVKASPISQSCTQSPASCGALL